MEMETKNLKNNLVLHNYKELCSNLDIKPTTGKAKILMLKDLHRFCNYTKVGHKFHIHEVYEVPINKTSRADNKWLTDIELVLLDFLARGLDPDTFDEVSWVYLSKRELLTLSGLCTEVFFKERVKHNNSSCPSKAGIDFFDDSSSKMKDITRSLITSLKSRYIVVISDVYMFNNVGSAEQQEASHDLHVRISETYGECLSAPNISCSSEFMVVKKGKAVEYYTLVAERLLEKLNIKNVKPKLKFSFTGKLSIGIIRMKQSLELVTGSKIKTNDKMLDFLEAKLKEHADNAFYLGNFDFKTKKPVSGEELKQRYIREYKEFTETIKLTEEVS